MNGAGWEFWDVSGAPDPLHTGDCAWIGGQDLGRDPLPEVNVKLHATSMLETPFRHFVQAAGR